MDREKRERILREAQDVYNAYVEAERELEHQRIKLGQAIQDVINAGDIAVFVRDRASLNANAESVQAISVPPEGITRSHINRYDD